MKKIISIERKKKRAQMKMFESIIALIIFFFLLVFGIIMYAKINGYNSQKDAIENKEKKAMEISQRIAFLSELQHTKEGVIVYDSVDLLKLKAFTALSEQDKRIFSKIFPDTDITIYQVYPKPQPYPVYEGYKKIVKKPGEKNASAKVSFAPISIYDPIEDRYNFGYLEVKVYTE